MVAAYSELDDSIDTQFPKFEATIEAAFTCLGPVPSETHAMVSEYEAAVLLGLSRREQLLISLEHYFERWAAVAPPKRQARQLTRYGLLMDELGFHGESLIAYAEAASIVPELEPDQAIRQLSETGEHFRELNRLTEAKRYFAAANTLLAGLEESVTADGSFLYHVGNLRFRQGLVLISESELDPTREDALLEESLPFLQESLDLFRSHPGGVRRIPFMLVALASANRRLANYEVALGYLNEINKEKHNLGANYVSYSYHAQHARVLSKLGEKGLAEHEALRALGFAEDIGEAEILADAHQTLGDVAVEAAAVAPASERSTYLDNAEAYYLRAAQLAIEHRSRFGLLDVSPSVWEIKQAPLRALTRLYLEQGRVADAFVTLDATRARYLADLRRAADRRTELVPRQRAALDSLYRAQEDARRALDGARLPVTERSRLHTVIQQAQVEIDRLTEVPARQETPDAASVPDLQRRLADRHQALLTFFLHEDEAYAFALTPDTLAVASLDRAVLDTTLAATGAWSDVWGPHASRTAFDLDRLYRLYGLLIRPLEAVLEPDMGLVIVPEGPLAQVPFGLLTTAPHPSRTYASAPYLLRSHPVSTALSVAALLDPPRRQRARLPLLALGRTSFDDESIPLPEHYAVALTQQPGTRAALSPTPLPLVETELRAAQRHLGGRILLGDAATEAAFFRDAPRAQVLHLASHALADPDAPMSSFILLSSDSTNAQRSGVLHLSEMRQASLTADLVLLSACNTARGSAHLSEGVIGMQYAFQAAGARSVLATHWPVNDATMTALVERFYAHLADGLPKDQALQRAQLDYLARHDGALAHPVYWAGLVLQGDTAPLARPRAARWLLLLGGLLLLAGGVVAYRHRSSRSPTA